MLAGLTSEIPMYEGPDRDLTMQQVASSGDGGQKRRLADTLMFRFGYGSKQEFRKIDAGPKGDVIREQTRRSEAYCGFERK